LCGLLRLGLGAHQGLGAEGRHVGLLAFFELLRSEAGVVVLFEGGVQAVLGLEGLQPHLALRAQ